MFTRMPEVFPCPICHSTTAALYKELEDKLYQVEYLADLFICANHLCGHVFLAPPPTQKEIASFYKSYSTHHIPVQNRNTGIRIYSALCNLMGVFDRYSEQVEELRFAGLSTLQSGKILDVGCGSGALLHQLTTLGWSECYGIDFDEHAINKAKSRGLKNVKVASFEVLETEDVRYDYILFNHVIEHLVDPEETLRIACTLLSEKGRLIIRTPNNQSFLSRLFKSRWRGWEPPRHLHIFSAASLEMLSAKVGLKALEIHTSNGMLQGLFFESVKIVTSERSPLKVQSARIFSRALFPLIVLISSLMHKLDKNAGEELVFILEKA